MAKQANNSYTNGQTQNIAGMKVITFSAYMLKKE